MPAGFSRAQHSPGDAITSGIQAGKRPLQSTDIWKGVFFRHKDLVHHDHAGDGGPQPNLAMNGGCGQALHALIENKAANFIGIVLGPDHEDIGNGAVGNPGL